jgi:hypothetical protein
MKTELHTTYQLSNEKQIHQLKIIDDLNTYSKKSFNNKNYEQKSAFYINDIIKMKERKLPPKVKIIEALSAVADERITIEDLLSKE